MTCCSPCSRCQSNRSRRGCRGHTSGQGSRGSSGRNQDSADTTRSNCSRTGPRASVRWRKREWRGRSAQAAYDCGKTKTRKQPAPSSQWAPTATWPCARPSPRMITALRAAPGQTVAAGAPLAEMAQAGSMWLRVPLYAGDLAAIDPSKPAAFSALWSGSEHAVANRTPRRWPAGGRSISRQHRSVLRRGGWRAASAR